MPPTNFTPEELNQLKILTDPVAWAKVYLNWDAFDYQMPILHGMRDKKKVVLRLGRRLGKTECMCIIILWYAFTQINRGENAEQYDILVVCPYETQVDLIFERLNQLIESSPHLKASVKKSVEHNIVFNNGADIKGLTAGSKSSTGAANTRGQRADVLILDECDYMLQKDVSNLVNIRNQDPGRIRIFAASTPTGARNHFYRWCVGANNHKGRTAAPNGWWEFFAPSTVNKKLHEVDPDTGMSYIEELRQELPENDFLHEVMAEFGEELAGVYAKKHLDSAVELAKTLDIKFYDINNAPPKRGPRILGVDWDKYKATPVLFGLEFDLFAGIYRPIYREEIPKSKFALSYAVNEIIESDKAFDWNYIFVDRGYGEMQVEQLTLHGVKTGNTKFSKKIVGVHFSDKIKVRDPYTKKVEKKPVKPFMVNYSVLAYEKGIMAMPYDKRIIEQLEGYRVEKISANGVPTYTDENEHFVDAQNLCFLGFALKYDNLIRQKAAAKVLTVGPIARPDDETKSRDMQQGTTTKKFKGKAGSVVLAIKAKKQDTSRGGPGRQSFKRRVF